MILLNKIDLATQDQLDEVDSSIRRLNRLAQIHRTRNSDLDLAAIFDLDGADFAAKIDQSIADEDHHESHAGHGHRHHHHLQDIETVCIVEPGTLDGMKVGLFGSGH